MPNSIEFKVDQAGALRALTRAPRDIQRNLRRELTVIFRDSVDEARDQMLSGMKAKGRYGYKWVYYGAKGIIMQATGNTGIASQGPPNSWAGALEGGPGGAKGFRHPIYATGPRKNWNWGPGKKGTQKAKPVLQRAWAKRRATAIPRAEAAVQIALDASFK